jgi:pimeloyl-ACP methyl ester carboxylesterase
MLRLARASEQRLPSVMRRPRLRHLAFRDVMRHGELVPPAEAIDIVRSAIGCSIADRVIAALRTPESATLAGLEDVAAPVLLAWPQHDRLLPIASCAPRLRREIPGAEFRLLSGCGHAPMWDDARLVAATVREWVDRHSERSRAEPAIGVEG